MGNFLKSFSFRYFTSFLLLSLFCFLIGGYFFLKIIKNYFEDELNEKMLSIGKSIASNLELYIPIENEEKLEDSKYLNYLKEKLKKFSSKLNLKKIYIFNLKGELIASIDDLPEGIVLGSFLTNPYILENLKKGKESTTILYKIKDEYYKSAFIPIRLDNKINFGIGIEMPAEYVRNFKKFQLNIFIFFFLSIILSLSISFFLSKSISIPLKKLIKETDNLIESDFEKKINLDSNTELDKIGSALEILRQKIIKRDQYLKMMVSQIAHEIKNPLSIYNFYLSFLSDKNLTSQQRIEYTNILKEETEKIEELLDNFINFVKKKQPEFEYFSLNVLFNQIEKFFKKKAETQGIEIITEVADNQKIFSDKNFLFQILFNLIKNSFEAMENKGKIFMNGKIEGDFYRISVKDQGKGIKEEIKDKIFEPFFTTKAKGVGLGLNIVEEYVKKLNGKLKFSSKEGEGTEFIIYLPKRREDGNFNS